MELGGRAVGGHEGPMLRTATGAYDMYRYRSYVQRTGTGCRTVPHNRVKKVPKAASEPDWDLRNYGKPQNPGFLMVRHDCTSNKIK